MATHSNNRKMIVKKSSAGLGLFADQDLKKEEFLIEYHGEKLTHEESNERGGKYLFTLNDLWVIDGSARSNIARYFNHACTPNVEAVIEDDAHIMFYALRDIKKGEELTFDYGEEYFDDIISKIGCKCRSCYKN